MVRGRPRGMWQRTFEGISFPRFLPDSPTPSRQSSPHIPVSDSSLRQCFLTPPPPPMPPLPPCNCCRNPGASKGIRSFPAPHTIIFSFCDCFFSSSPLLSSVRHHRTFVPRFYLPATISSLSRLSLCLSLYFPLFFCSITPSFTTVSTLSSLQSPVSHLCLCTSVSLFLLSSNLLFYLYFRGAFLCFAFAFPRICVHLFPS